METICSLFSVTRQAYYKARLDQDQAEIADMVMLTLVKEIREDIPGLGVRKLLHVITPEFDKHKIKMGRDHLFTLLRNHGLLIRRRKRMIKTTDSFHRYHKYKNRIKHLQVTGPEQLWVSDITCIKTAEGYSYLTLITDAYSRKIMGYSLHPTLEAAGCIEALEMAISSRKYLTTKSLMHHSDRGVQYCCHAYIKTLQREFIDISMTESGSPYDNAMAERINETIKYDYLGKKMHNSHSEASCEMDRIVKSYNERRPHQSINYLTPEQAHSMDGTLLKRWKKYTRKSKNISGSQEQSSTLISNN